ncbi:MAG: isochorismatase family protein [Kiloniellales bacterium]
MLMNSADSLLLAIDFQSKLAPAIHEGEAAIAAAARLIQIARLLEVPCLATEQYPQGLGHTHADLLPLFQAEEVMAKLAFSAGREKAFCDAVASTGRNQLVVMGMEAHVCVLQTALIMAEKGYSVFVVADAVGSRDPKNRTLGLERMRAAGLTIVSSEMVAFEWLARAGTEDFKAALPFIK